MGTLWIEIVSEPMPPSLQEWAWQNFMQSFKITLQQKWGYALPVVEEQAQNLSTPYRLIWQIKDIADTTPQREIKQKGPRTNASEKALAGFLQKHSITKEQCTLEETSKGTFWYYKTSAGGEKMEEVLGKAIIGGIVGMKWQKAMRFAHEEALWIRPLQRLIAVFKGKVLAGGMDCANKQWVKQSDNHESYLPFVATTWHDISDISAKDEKKLVQMTNLADYEKVGIHLQPQKRAEQLQKQATKKNQKWCRQMALLVERGDLLQCRLQNHFLNLPDEVIQTALLDHMKVWVADIGKDSIHFYAAIEAKLDCKQNKKIIQEGYERVAVARLIDADFFWQEDSKLCLADRLPLLHRRIWHKGLQSVGDKALRLETLSGKIVGLLAKDPQTINFAKRAGLLAKSDLSTYMVGEYPSLQGIIGGFYAQREGEHERIVQAIRGHYAEEKLQHNDPVCLALFIADRVDTLVGMWKSNNRPTGSRDPFALRRATKELANVLFARELPINLATLIKYASATWRCTHKNWQEDLTSYYHERLLETIATNEFERIALTAILAKDSRAKLSAKTTKEHLRGFIQLHEDGRLALLTQMFRRLIGFLDEPMITGDYSSSLFSHPQEKELADVVEKATKLLGKKEYNVLTYASHMLDIKPSFDAFCDQVRVFDTKDISKSKNRALLLESLRGLYATVSDFHPFVRYYSKREEI